MDVMVHADNGLSVTGGAIMLGAQATEQAMHIMRHGARQQEESEQRRTPCCGNAAEDDGRRLDDGNPSCTPMQTMHLHTLEQDAEQDKVWMLITMVTMATCARV